MTNQWDIEGRTFLITGGASGLGALYAEYFLKEAAKNVAILDIAEELGKKTETRLNYIYPNRVTFIKCDAGNEESIALAFGKVISLFKQIDVIINNAGIVDETSPMWRTMCNINLEGVISFTMKGLAHMRKDRGGPGGTIINISSTAALSQFRQLPVYSGTKIALLHFSATLAREPTYTKTGVRVLVLCPGLTATSIADNLGRKCYDKEEGDELVAIVQGMEAQKPESVAEVIVEIYKTGANGSIWLSKDNKPPKDITPIFQNLFQQLAE